MARANSLKEKRKIEEEKLSLKIKEEELQIKTELEMSAANSRIIEDLDKSILEDQQLKESLLKENTESKIRDSVIKFEKNQKSRKRFYLTLNHKNGFRGKHQS